MSEESKYYTINPGESDPSAVSTVIVGVVGVVLAWLIIAGLEVVYYKTARAEFDRKVVQQEPAGLREARTQQLGQLSDYRWIDKDAGIVQLPIDRAMEVLVERQRPGRGTAAGAEAAEGR